MSVYLIHPTICYEAGDWYIGSTTKTIKRRLVVHISLYNLWSQNKIKKSTSVYQLFDKYGIDNCEIVELESGIADDMLKWKEREYIEKYKCVNIMKRPIVEEQERKQLKIERRRKYYDTNKDDICAKNKKWNETNKEKKREIDSTYREANKEKIRERKKAYYEANKERINQARREKWNAQKNITTYI